MYSLFLAWRSLGKWWGDELHAADSPLRHGGRTKKSVGSGDVLAGHGDRLPDRSITREVSTAPSARSMTSASICSGSAAWAKANP